MSLRKIRSELVTHLVSYSVFCHLSDRILEGIQRNLLNTPRLPIRQTGPTPARFSKGGLEMNPIEVNFDRNYVSTIETQVARVIQKSLDRRTSVFVNPTLDIRRARYDGTKFSKKYRDLLTLIILTWYSDYFGEFSDYIRYEIGIYLDKVQQFPELNASLTSKKCLDFVILLFIKENSTRALFGNILDPNQINKVLDSVRLKLVPRRVPRRPVFRRGYKDKGSLRPETKWLPNSDWSFNEEQLRIEESRQRYQDLVTLFVRASGDWVLSCQVNRKEVFHND